MLTRNRKIWQQCLEPVKLPTEPSSLYTINQNLLMSYTSTTGSEPTTRPVSPLSELEEEEVEHAKQGEVLVPSATPSTSSFYRPDPACPNYWYWRQILIQTAKRTRRYHTPDMTMRGVYGLISNVSWQAKLWFLRIRPTSPTRYVS
jgi:hypothetical protein